MQKTADDVRETYDRLMAPVIARREQMAAERAYYRKLEREAV
jgi:hypothetical protein